MSLAASPTSGRDPIGFFGRRRTAALTLLVSAGIAELFAAVQHLSTNKALVLAAHHGAFFLGLVWVSGELAFSVMVGYFDRRYRGTGSTTGNSSGAAPTELSRRRRNRSEPGRDTKGVNPRGRRRA